MTKIYKDTNGNTYTEDQTYTATGLQSCSRHKNSTYGTKYTNTFRDYCPHCGKTGVLTNKHKYSARYEGQVTCGNCDADYCIACGYEKVNGSKYHLTILTETTETKTKDSMLTDGKKVYITMDHDIGTSADSRFMNNVITVLKNEGINVIGSAHGPNSWTEYIRNHTSASNTIVLGIVNGSDAGVVSEATYNFGYNKKAGAEIGFPKGIDKSFHGKYGFLTNNRGNMLVLAFTEKSKDFFHTDGVDYKYLERAHDMSYGPNANDFKGVSYPLALLKEYGISVIWAAGHNSDGTGDSARNSTGGTRTGELFVKWAKSITDSEIMSTTPTTTDGTTPDTTTDTTTDSETKLKTKIIEKTYTKAYYQQLYTLKTDQNGAFTTNINLPYKGKYKVNMVFSGTKEYSQSTRTINITYNSGDIFKQALLQTKTTTTTTDGNTKVESTGTIDSKKNQHTITTRETITYNNGIEEKRTTTIIDNDKVDTTYQTTTDGTSTVTNPTDSGTTTPTNPSSDTNTSVVVDPTKKDPFTNDIPCLTDSNDKNNSIPDVAHMGTSSTTYVWTDYTKTYTLSKARFMEVLDRDSKIMQLHDFSNSKYTAFTSDEEPNTYHVIKRERWNAVEEALYYRQVQNDEIGNPVKMPDAIKIDFANQKLTAKIGSTWRSVSISFKASECNYWFCADRQNTGYTCGPTSSAVATQVLHKYLSEGYMQSKVHAHDHSGSAPDGNILALNNHGFSATLYTVTSNWKDYLNRLRKGQPVVIHQVGHYLCSADVSDDGQQILVLNSAGEINKKASYNKLKTGWNDKSTVKSLSNSPGWLVAPNWTLTESEKAQINHFYNSMGGAWRRKENRNEKIRKAYS